MKVTVNNKEVENPLARALVIAAFIVFIACMIVLLLSFAIILIPLVIFIIIIGTIATHGNKKRKN